MELENGDLRHTVQVDLLRDSVMDGQFQKRKRRESQWERAVFHSAASRAKLTSVPRSELA